MTTSPTTHQPEPTSPTRRSSEELDRVVGGTLPEGYYVTVYSREGGGPARYTLYGPSGVLGTFSSMTAAESAASQDVLARQGQ